MQSAVLLYTVVMVSHVVVMDEPESLYEWRECSGSCEQLVHHCGSADSLNSYPREWIEALVGFKVKSRLNPRVFYCDSEGRFHRLDGPAIITSGREYWYKHGKRHRENGPAVVSTSEQGFEWWVDGQLHRLEKTNEDGTVARKIYAMDSCSLLCCEA